MVITKQAAYLLGLITGRGHIYKDSKFIAIEFSHANEYAEGIAHCPKCGWFATQKKGDTGNLTCKNPLCGHNVSPKVKKVYNQPKSTVESLNNVIIPFLQSDINAKYEISGNKSMTLLIIDFTNNTDYFKQITDHFKNDTSFDSFHIPLEINSLKKPEKIEFVNGLLDTSGFPSPGGWLNRDGVNGHGRMRAYFQIVRNWHLPVEIDNFLRREFNLPIHNIDWGHPNIRDGNLEDFFNTRSTSWSREHQVKFFPEYYTEFSFRISSKQSLFDELVAHNLKTGFTEKDDWFPPSKFSRSKLKANHPGENDPRIPVAARKHFDAFWQINFAMGCEFLKKLSESSKNPLAFYVSGDPNSVVDLLTIEQEHSVVRETLFQAAKTRNSKPKVPVLAKIKLKSVELESDTYQPLVDFFKPYLDEKFNDKTDVFDTSSGNLSAFLKNGNPDLLLAFDYCERYRIRPDVVGFLTNTKQLVFIESKITYLDLTALGQLIGYCMVGQPVIAVLISTRPINPIFLRTLKANPTLLNYGENKYIQIATLVDNKVQFEKI